MPELIRYMPWAPTASRRTTETYVETMVRRWDEATDWAFTVFHEDSVAGSISLMGYEALSDLAEIGYWMRSDLTGRGLMTEAAAAIVDFGFQEIRCHRLELLAAVDNIGSIRVAEKLGFSREGLLREANRAPATGGRHDMYAFGLLVHEWPRG